MHSISHSIIQAFSCVSTRRVIINRHNWLLFLFYSTCFACFQYLGRIYCLHLEIYQIVQTDVKGKCLLKETSAETLKFLTWLRLFAGASVSQVSNYSDTFPFHCLLNTVPISSVPIAIYEPCQRPSNTMFLLSTCPSLCPINYMYWRHRLGSDSEQWHVAGFWEHDNENTHSTKFWEFVGIHD